MHLRMESLPLRRVHRMQLMQEGPHLWNSKNKVRANSFLLAKVSLCRYSPSTTFAVVDEPDPEGGEEETDAGA